MKPSRLLPYRETTRLISYASPLHGMILLRMVLKQSTSLEIQTLSQGKNNSKDIPNRWSYKFYLNMYMWELCISEQNGSYSGKFDIHSWHWYDPLNHFQLYFNDENTPRGSSLYISYKSSNLQPQIKLHWSLIGFKVNCPIFNLSYLYVFWSLFSLPSLSLFLLFFVDLFFCFMRVAGSLPSSKSLPIPYFPSVWDTWHHVHCKTSLHPPSTSFSSLLRISHSFPPQLYF